MRANWRLRLRTLEQLSAIFWFLILFKVITVWHSVGIISSEDKNLWSFLGKFVLRTLYYMLHNELLW